MLSAQTNAKLMDVKQAADYVGLSTFTVRRLAKTGSLPAAKIGRSYRFKQDDIDAYLRDQYSDQSKTVEA